MRQLYKNDRKLRTISLLKYTKISITKIDETAKAKCNPEQEINVKAESPQLNFCLKFFPQEMMQQ